MDKLFKIENKKLVMYVIAEKPTSALLKAVYTLKDKGIIPGVLDEEVNISLLCDEKDIVRG